MNTNTCNITLKQHTLWGQLTSLGMGAVVYPTSDRGTFNSIEWGSGA